MDENARSPRLVRFGIYEVDLRAGELRKNGLKVRLQEKPFQVLEMLLEHPGEIVTREELQKKLWPENTFVDFDHSMNTAVTKLREALGDSADNPRFVETLARRGYRFIYPVAAVEAVAAVSDRRLLEEKKLPAVRDRRYSRRWLAALAGAATLGIAALLLALNVAGLRDRLLTAVGARHGVPLPKIESIAVLPLENLSRDPEQEYFADGMTEELITYLGRVSALRVISRTSVMQYKGAKKPLAQIARELNVDAIVEGAVLRSGNRVRITAQLIQANPEKHLWADSYERDLREILALQSEVARAIAGEIKIKLAPEQQARLAKARPVNPEAYEAYLKGRHVQIFDDAKAVEFYQRATQIDPTWAPAYAAIVVPTLWRDLLPPMEACAKMRTAAGKALELDDTLSDANYAMAWVRYQCDWDWPGAERDFKRAIELDPTNSQARHYYSHYLLGMRRFDESLNECKRALERDPLSELLNFHLIDHYVFAHQPDLAIEQGRKTLELFPNSGGAHDFRMLAYEMKGLYEQAIADESDAKLAARLKRAYRRFGARGYWQSRLDTALEQSKQGYVSPLYIAGFYAQLGQREEAFAWLEKAYAERSLWMAQLSCFPRFDPLRSDPRFQDLLRRMKFPP